MAEKHVAVVGIAGDRYVLCEYDDNTWKRRDSLVDSMVLTKDELVSKISNGLKVENFAISAKNSLRGVHGAMNRYKLAPNDVKFYVIGDKNDSYNRRLWYCMRTELSNNGLVMVMVSCIIQGTASNGFNGKISNADMSLARNGSIADLSGISFTIPKIKEDDTIEFAVGTREIEYDTHVVFGLIGNKLVEASCIINSAGVIPSSLKVELISLQKAKSNIRKRYNYYNNAGLGPGNEFVIFDSKDHKLKVEDGQGVMRIYVAAEKEFTKNYHILACMASAEKVEVQLLLVSFEKCSGFDRTLLHKHGLNISTHGNTADTLSVRRVPNMLTGVAAGLQDAMRVPIESASIRLK